MLNLSIFFGFVFFFFFDSYSESDSSFSEDSDTTFFFFFFEDFFCTSASNFFGTFLSLPDLRLLSSSSFIFILIILVQLFHDVILFQPLRPPPSSLCLLWRS